MGRKKNLSREQLAKATMSFEPLRKSYRNHQPEKQKKVIEALFEKIFQGKISEHKFEYGLEQIKYLFTPTSKFSETPEKVILKAFKKEHDFLDKHKSKIPAHFLTLVSMNLIDQLIKRYQFTPNQPALEIIKSIHELSLIDGEDFTDKELERVVPLSVIEHILKRAEYDTALKGLIYRAEKKRLKETFWTYCFHAANEWPYYYYTRAYKAQTLFEYLYFIHYFKLDRTFSKKSPYPPKRIEALECIQTLRKGDHSTGKIFTEIQAILDPDHSSNHCISTEITL